MKNKLRLLVLIAGIITLAGTLADAATITVAWDSSESTNVIGYRVYYRASTNAPYSAFQTSSSLQHSITNLAYSTTYYMVVTAVAAGSESEFSNEVSATTPAQPPPQPPRNLRVITTTVQGASDTDGPWVNLAQVTNSVPLDSPLTFFRAHMKSGVQ